MDTCEVENCLRPVLRRGLCRYHYNKKWSEGAYSKDGSIPPRAFYKREYSTWAGMKQRCSNPKGKEYKHYGGRGIKVCPAWGGKRGFKQFLADMGECPKGYTLDRIDVNGDYCPENCRWADWNIQGANKQKRSNRSSHYIGVSKLGHKWKAELIVKGERYYTIHMTEEEALKARKAMERKYLGKEL